MQPLPPVPDRIEWFHAVFEFHVMLILDIGVVAVMLFQKVRSHFAAQDFAATDSADVEGVSIILVERVLEGDGTFPIPVSVKESNV